MSNYLPRVDNLIVPFNAFTEYGCPLDIPMESPGDLNFSTLERGGWLLDNSHTINDPKVFGTVALFSPISSEGLGYALTSYNS